jgi:hypothetical protein
MLYVFSVYQYRFCLINVTIFIKHIGSTFWKIEILRFAQNDVKHIRLDYLLFGELVNVRMRQRFLLPQQGKVQLTAAVSAGVRIGFVSCCGRGAFTRMVFPGGR